jgi:transcriptional regulator with XRE-family HTH domain
MASQFICSVLRERGWTQARFAKQCGIKQPLISKDLSSNRKHPISPAHLKKYLECLNHSERKRLFAAWMKGIVPSEVMADLLESDGNLRLDVKAWLPALKNDDKEMLLWWAQEMTHDGELEELFKLLSARAGYRPKTEAGPVKRRRRD